MALTITRVTPTPQGNNTTGTTFQMTDIGAAFAVNDMVVLCIAADNAGSAGSATNITSVADTAGNTWVERSNTVFDNGAASAGIENAIYTCLVTNAIISSDNLTITFNVTTVAKAVVIYKIAHDGTVRGNYLATAAFAGATTGAPAHVTGTITSGDTVFMLQAVEGNSTPTGDSDTTNGSWSTVASAAFGTTTAGAMAISQYKTVTGTATQTWNPTYTSADSKGSWISITPQTFTSAGTGSPTDVRDTAAGVGKLNYSSSGTLTDVRDTAAGVATATSPTSDATGTLTDVRDTAAGVVDPWRLVTGAVTDTRDVAAGVAIAIPIQGSGAVTDVRDTTTGAGEVWSDWTAPVTGITHNPLAGGPTDGRDIAAGTAKLNYSSSGAVTDVRDTAAGVATSGTASAAGTGTPTDQRDTATGAAVVRVSASGTPTDVRDIASGSAVMWRHASGAVTDQRDTATGAVVIRISASGSLTDQRDTAQGISGDIRTGTGAVTDQRDTATGAVVAHPVASGTVTDQRDIAAGVGKLNYSSSGSPTDQRDTASGSVIFRISSTGAVTDTRDIASGAAVCVPLSVATGTPTDQRDIAAGVAVFTITAAGAITDQRDIAAGVTGDQRTPVTAHTVTVDPNNPTIGITGVMSLNVAVNDVLTTVGIA